MKAIISQLTRYLRTLGSTPTSSSYRRIFEHPFQLKEFRAGFLESLPDKNIGEICFLNFNYTNTLKSYVQNMSMDMRLTTNHIHGSVTELDNPIIFGFGDEVDRHYGELEDCGDNEYLKFIKSFWYLRTSNYYDLLRFVDSDDYQIYIIGHSCGLSDRTLLRMLFKHSKCKSIKIFYFENEPGKDNFTNITNEISRHFSDKEMLREKVVNYEFSEKMPQVK